MSIALHAILRPFGVNPVSCYLGRHARFCFRASWTEAVNWEKKQGNSKRTRKTKAAADVMGLEVLCDDGFGSVTMKDYLEAVRTMPIDDGGPPRWFCPVECGRPVVNSAPLLLFLPGTDGVGMELILHHKSLGMVFEVRCLHIPVNDRTSFGELLQIVDECIKYEHALSPNRPVFVVGDSLGGCLAISVAAHNPEIDLVLIVVNPGTSFAETLVQAILPLLDLMPSNLSVIHPHLLRYFIGEPLKMSMASIQNDLSLQESLQKFLDGFNSMQTLTYGTGDIIRMDNIVWKLKLLKSGAAYANSRLHAVQAEVLLLASGNENLSPTGEADRLLKTLNNCKARYFRNRGHTLLMEHDFNLLTVIKGVNMYRRGRKRDAVTDFLPPTLSEFKKTFGEDFKQFNQLLSPVMLSTLETGKIVRGLAGVPDKGPVLFVGYHQLMAMELSTLLEGLFREKKPVRALAHEVFFKGNFGTLREELSLFDALCGVREALHRKGESYQCFWPNKPEFVRMAARFGVTIVPFGCVGEDDFFEVVVDYNDQKNIPCLRDWITSFNEDLPTLRDTVIGENGNQDVHLPVLLPKVPGRLYFLFGKPIVTKGMDNLLSDSKQANDLYLHTKLEVENLISYLKRKREEDPYRSITPRILYQAIWGASAQVPTFEP
ncbi:phytyl ester synthase 1, chloroplastic-like isoform X2 [Lolium rigidum]|uniref:phytyl ester synthase 1, chloroplastic-like isoform X2 n=1 Tax=Lolium rigidum TaxID=89674 RepID=UPI001F5C4BC9|nr:phytyl ester synthase 1, chloroplastic-like isoform X2 [Lolium rigidum]